MGDDFALGVDEEGAVAVAEGVVFADYGGLGRVGMVLGGGVEAVAANDFSVEALGAVEIDAPEGDAGAGMVLDPGVVLVGGNAGGGVGARPEVKNDVFAPKAVEVERAA